MELMQRRRELMGMQGELPSAYRKVGYLQTLSNSGTYIDSGIVMTEDLVFEIEFQLLEVINGTYFMGRYAGTTFFLYVSSGLDKTYFQTAFGANWANTNLVVDTNRHKFTYSFSNGNSIVKNGDDVILQKAISNMSTTHIFIAGTTASSGTIPVKTFSSKMSKNGLVIQNLVPCVRKSDNKPGMFDTVSKTFYTNAGIGEFIVPT